MGSGKSSVGRALSWALDWEFVDTDALIVAQDGRDIDTIFEEVGEEYFRQLERGVAVDMCRWKHTVIATGGGMGAAPDIAGALHETGLVVYLRASADTLWDRISKDKTGAPRPLAMEKGVFLDRLEERDPLYESVADVTLPTDVFSINQVVEEISRILKTIKS